MPWSTPSLSQVRALVRDAVQGYLPGADASIPNSVLRVTSDVQGALCHLTLQYLDWLANQLFPDTAEQIWLDRFATIWLVNADGSTGRKMATLAAGSVTFTGTTGTLIPMATQLVGPSSLVYQTLADLTIGAGPSAVDVQALDPGAAGNIYGGGVLTLAIPINGADSQAIVDNMYGGADQETDDELRLRILDRIRQPPMGGDASDYVAWALRVPGVTRAWVSTEMGIGTASLRFMMDDLRADFGGFPLPDDVDAVAAYINTVRPVTVKDMFVTAPIPLPINLRLSWLDSDVEATRGAIEASLLKAFYVRQKPGQTWFRAWSDEGIMAAAGVNAYDLVANDVTMPSPGYMAVLGDLTFG